jgi:hypothetical protein
MIDIPEDWPYIIFAVVEFFMFFTHLMVHLGIKNPYLHKLMGKWNYFSADAVMSILNAFVFWDNYYLFRVVLIFAILVHFYYVYNMLFRTDICRIFFWSSLDCKEYRFSLKYLKENIETAIDITCHFVGFFMAYTSLSNESVFPCQIICLIAFVMTPIFTPGFYTRSYMMPFKMSTLNK